MAKFYGFAGTRRGKVGNEVYYISKTQNIVKRKPVYIFDPRTEKQVRQRIKVKNAILGLKNVKNILDLDTFTNKSVVENNDNAFMKNNIRNCSMIDKRTSNIPNFPSITSNLCCSYGTLDTVPIQKVNDYYGLLVIPTAPGQYDDNTTVAFISNQLLDNYAYLRNGDAITFIYYYCKNIICDEDEFFKWEGNENMKNVVDIDTGRRTFIINTNNNTSISEYGLRFLMINQDTYIIGPLIQNDLNNRIMVYDNNHPCYMCAFYARKIDENTYNFCPSSFAYNSGYNSMLEYSRSEAYDEIVLSSWHANEPRGYDL